MTQLKSDVNKEITDFAGSELLAKLLYKRNINTLQKAKDFLNPLEMEITSPYVFSDMQKTVDRIDTAIKKQEKILIWGDFDADGITSTALLTKTLKEIGANVSYYLPSRQRENHGLNIQNLTKLISKLHVKLIITVDCGISNISEIKFANNFNVDVIVTDHHEAGNVLPDAFAIINPKAQYSLKENLSAYQIENLTYLAGVGVAFKLSCALLQYYSKENFVNELYPLLTVGTIADVVPLLGENRAFVITGLKLIQNDTNIALSNLLKSAQIAYKNNLTSENIAFSVAPRINAVGRLSDPDEIVEFLLSDNLDFIEEECEKLNQYNNERQELCEQIFQEASSQVNNDENIIFLHSDKWHLGIIGIVASKLVENFYKPSFLMTTQENSNIIRCSCRSIPEIHLYNLLNMNSDIFEGFGGHALAAGFTFDKTKISMEEVKTRLSDSINEIIGDEKLSFTPQADLIIEPSDINFDLISIINKLEPCGASNPKPVFELQNINLDSYKIIGQNNNHLKITVSDESSLSFNCVYWNKTELPYKKNSKIDLFFAPQLNTFNGNTTVQLEIKHIQGDEINQLNNLKILDHRKKFDIYEQISDYLSNENNDIIVFAENKNTIEKLCSYNFFKERIVKRNNLRKSRQIMFFDYPADKESFKNIINNVEPQIVHIMQKHSEHLTAEGTIKQLFGMLKYICNHENGCVDYNRLKIGLCTNDTVLNSALKILNSSEMYKIKSLTEDKLQVEFIKTSDTKTLIQNPIYENLVNEIELIKDFQNALSIMSVEEILDITNQ